VGFVVHHCDIFKESTMKLTGTWLAGLALGCLLCAADLRAEGVKAGDKAPEFESVDDQGKPFKSSDVVGKKIVVVYFYPADMTGGCTKQACGFRDDAKDLQAKGIVVLGVSGDSAKNHKLFKKAHKLNFKLLADEKGELAKKFGVPMKPGEQSITREIDGEKVVLTRGVTIQRWTFIIDKDGKIAVARQVKDAGGDSKKILEEVEKLQK
jgi:peroxiredoxin Q/BCP